MEERTRPEEPAKETELKRPDEAIKDLEPDEQEGEAVKGGSFVRKAGGSTLEY